MNMFSLPVAAITNWNRRAEWDNRRRKPVLSDRIVNTLAAWLNGDIEHCWMGEFLTVEGATVDGDSIVVLFHPTDDGVPFRARFALMEMELATSAALRQSASAGT